MAKPIPPPSRDFEVKTLIFDAIQLREAPAEKKCDRKDTFEATIS